MRRFEMRARRTPATAALLGAALLGLAACEPAGLGAAGTPGALPSAEREVAPVPEPTEITPQQ